MPETLGHGSPVVFNKRPNSTFSSRIIRVLLPLVFFSILAAAAVFAILTILSNRSAKSPTQGKQTSRLSHAAEISSPAPHSLSPPANSSSASPPLPPDTVLSAPPELPQGIEAIDPALEAYEVLEKFLTASSLNERLSLIETKTTETELAKSSLAAALPAASNILQEARETNPVEQVVDYFYHVDFDAGNNNLDPHTILVRKRGGADPKVVADPFLDSFGGRLAAYIKVPTDKAGLFQVIVYPVASCNDEQVPNKEKKLTLKLLARENEREISRAYFGRQSRIGLMLEDGTYDLSFGKARPCTVMLRWNFEDRPETPYLEAIDLKTLDWNP
ncbi:MAG: hypothetical protein V4640_05120 [Verrucomicrobiota bacterium]